MTYWTSEEFAFASRRWDDGASATEIAAEMGCRFRRISRNAVIGKLHRSGMNHSSGKRLERETRHQKQCMQMNEGKKNPRAPKPKPKPPRTDAALLLSPKKRAKSTRKDAAIRCASPFKTCQWLDGDPLGRNFCGAPTCDPCSPYCAEHHARCHVKAAA